MVERGRVIVQTNAARFSGARAALCRQKPHRVLPYRRRGRGGGAAADDLGHVVGGDGDVGGQPGRHEAGPAEVGVGLGGRLGAGREHLGRRRAALAAPASRYFHEAIVHAKLPQFSALSHVPRSGRGHGEAAPAAGAAARDGGDEGLELLLLLVVDLGAVVELALPLAQRPLPLLQLDLHGVQLQVEVVHLKDNTMLSL